MDDEINHLTDHTDGRKYWGQPPHLLIALGFPCEDRSLYGYIQMVCGMSGGKPCKKTTRQLAKGADISVGKVVECKRRLRDSGIIGWTEYPTTNGAGHAIELLDVWDINYHLFADKHIPWADRVDRARADLSELARSYRERSSSQSSMIHEEHESSPNGEDARAGDGGTTNMFTAMGMAPPPTSVKSSSRNGNGKQGGDTRPRPLALTTRIGKVFDQTVEGETWITNNAGRPELLREIITDAREAHGGTVDEDRLLCEVEQATRNVMGTFRVMQSGSKPVIRFDRIPSAIRSLRIELSKRTQRAQTTDRRYGQGLEQIDVDDL